MTMLDACVLSLWKLPVGGFHPLYGFPLRPAINTCAVDVV